MTKALFGVEGEGQSDVQLMPSTVESGFEERNYFGLSDSSTVDSSTVTSFSGDSKDKFNLEATELRLGLPGSQCPEIDPELCLLSCGKLDEKPLLTLIPLKDGICSSSQKTAISGNKRGFSVTMEDSVEKTYSEGNWMFRASGSDSGASKSGAQGKIPVNGGMPAMLSSRPLPNSGVKSYVREQSGSQQGAMTGMSPKAKLELPSAVSGMGHSQLGASTKSNCEPAARAQVVGWPPIRSFRKNSLTNTSKNNDEVDGKPGAAPLFVKVSMDGAPYLRKVDLRVYSAYQELSSALGKMFSCFTLGQCGTHGASGRENGSETKLMDLLHGSEYVLTYEDKDGDWMLVGDVPWDSKGHGEIEEQELAKAMANIMTTFPKPTPTQENLEQGRGWKDSRSFKL